MTPAEGGAARYAATAGSDSHYIVNGKPYRVDPVDEDSFNIVDEDGDRIFCLWNGCAYGGSWYEVNADGVRVQP